MRRFVQAFSSTDRLPADFDERLTAAMSALPDRYNIAVRKQAGVLMQASERTEIAEFAWGIVPRWSKTPETKYTTVTARLERAPTSRVYRHAWERQHCVVPMTGYYKWDRSVSPRVPYFIQSMRGDVLFAAGLWECWDKDEIPLNTFSLLTHPNQAIPPPLVPDGPVFLPQDSWRSWLMGGQWMPMRFLQGLKQPALEAYPVSRAVRDPSRDDYTLLEPADPREFSATDDNAASETEIEDEDDA